MRKSVQLNVKRAVRSQRVVTPEGVRPATIVYDSGRISAVEDASTSTSAEDFGDRYILLAWWTLTFT